MLTGSQAVSVSSLAARSCVVALAIPVAVVERQEDVPRPDVADPRRRLDRAAPRGDLDHVAVVDAQPLGVLGVDLGERLGRGLRSSGDRPVLVRVWKW